MQLVFTIHVIITLVVLEPAKSKTCHDDSYVRCPKTNMYYTKLLSFSPNGARGRCCEADDPTYANQHATCLTEGLIMTRSR